MVWLSESDNKWYYSYPGASIIFDTEQEARNFMTKIDTAKAIVRAVQSLALVMDTAEDLVAEYWAVVGTGWVDDNVAPMGITAAQLTACITLLEQVNLLMSGEATTPVEHRVSLNQVRRVSA